MCAECHCLSDDALREVTCLAPTLTALKLYTICCLKGEALLLRLAHCCMFGAHIRALHTPPAACCDFSDARRGHRAGSPHRAALTVTGILQSHGQPESHPPDCMQQHPGMLAVTLPMLLPPAVARVLQGQRADACGSEATPTHPAPEQCCGPAAAAD